jgi:hypothetical protein
MLFLFLRLWSHYIAQAGLGLEFLLLQPPKSWDYRHVTTLSFHIFFEFASFIFIVPLGGGQRGR